MRGSLKESIIIHKRLKIMNKILKITRILMPVDACLRGIGKTSSFQLSIVYTYYITANTSSQNYLEYCNQNVFLLIMEVIIWPSLL